MTLEQGLLLAVLGATVVALALDRWRYDLVALCGLLSCVLLGLIPAGSAFLGFADPAVITVVAVLLLSRGVVQTGVVSWMARQLGGRVHGQVGLIAVLCALGMVLSAFMNNVGALALLMPVTLSLCLRHGIAPSRVLMPLAFATLLGGMTTLIGTPPNLLASGFHAQAAGEPLAMFDFALVGVPVALLGLAWLVLFGWRLLPQHTAADEVPSGDGYTAELVAGADCRFLGLGRAELAAAGVSLLGIVRDGRRVFARRATLSIRPGDLVVLEAGLANLSRLVNVEGFEVPDDGGAEQEAALVEAVVMPQSLALGSSARTLELLERWGVHLVGVARQGRRFEGRLADATLAVGDVLLVTGDPAQLRSSLSELGCMLLQDREVKVRLGRALPPFLVFGAAVAVAASGVLTPAVAFVTAAVVSFMAGWIRADDLRRNVDWSVVVLLAAMIPLGGALEATGAATLLAGGVLQLAGGDSPVLLLALTLAVTMLLTPFLNNPATVVVLAPIVVSLAQAAGLPVAPFLIAVALGASCDFLTPFGHHNNALIMGPGSYRFLDYPRAGWPLTLIVFASATVLIPWLWGLH